jgi:uncharacterized protein YegP (UPF0339 family)
MQLSCSGNPGKRRVEQQNQRTLGVYFEIYQQADVRGSGTQSELAAGAWRWRLKGMNEETITSGESYAHHADCLRAVYLIRSTSSHTPIRDV